MDMLSLDSGLATGVVPVGTGSGGQTGIETLHEACTLKNTHCPYPHKCTYMYIVQRHVYACR